VLRFLRDTPGQEALGIGYAAAYIRAASPETLRGPKGAEVLDALGTFADRLARRATSSAASTKPGQATLSAHLEVAMHCGVTFTTYEREGKVTLCYEGDAFRRVLDMRSADGARARAALGLTQLVARRARCVHGAGGAGRGARDAAQRDRCVGAADLFPQPRAHASRGHLEQRRLSAGAPR
jgi:hypothetical protein